MTSALVFLCVFALYYGLLKLWYCAPSHGLSLGVLSITKSHVFAVMMLLLLLFAVLRRVEEPGIGGTDAITYVRDFRNATKPLSTYLRWDKIIKLHIREPIYLYLMWAFRQITDNYKLYFLFLYGIIAACFSYAVTRSIPSAKQTLPALLILDAYLHSFNAMRNWIAIGLLMVAIVNLDRKKWLWGILFAVLAVGFHYSIFVFLAAYVACKVSSKIKWTRIRLFALWGATTVAVISAADILRAWMQGTKFAYYSNRSSSWYGYLPVLFVTFLGIVFYYDLIRINPRNKQYVLLSIANSSLLYIYVRVGGYRINDTFILVRVILLSQLMRAFDEVFKGDARKIARILLTTFIVMYFIQQFCNILEVSGVVPYLVG